MAWTFTKGLLINWVLQKLSTLIGQLATVHICDWLTKDKQIYKLSSIIFMTYGSLFSMIWAIVKLHRVKLLMIHTWCALENDLSEAFKFKFNSLIPTCDKDNRVVGVGQITPWGSHVILQADKLWTTEAWVLGVLTHLKGTTWPVVKHNRNVNYPQLKRVRKVLVGFDNLQMKMLFQPF